MSNCMPNSMSNSILNKSASNQTFQCRLPANTSNQPIQTVSQMLEYKYSLPLLNTQK